jgi:hypothetical protein
MRRCQCPKCKPRWRPPCSPVIALPPNLPRYVIPGSQWLDPPYSWIRPPTPPTWNAHWPFPRKPWPFESCTRAPGTGLIFSPDPCFPQPCHPLRMPPPFGPKVC